MKGKREGPPPECEGCNRASYSNCRDCDRQKMNTLDQDPENVGRDRRRRAKGQQTNGSA